MHLNLIVLEGTDNRFALSLRGVLAQLITGVSPLALFDSLRGSEVFNQICFRDQVCCSDRGEAIFRCGSRNLTFSVAAK